MRKKVDETQVKNNYIASPLNYTGNKRRLVPQLLPLFPKRITTYIELFAGSCVMAANVSANKYVFNDLLGDVLDLVKLIIDSDSDELIKKIRDITAEFKVDNRNQNRENFLKLLDYYNTENRELFVLFALVSASYSNQLRFSQEAKLNGKSSVNKSFQSKDKKLSLSWGERFFNDNQALNLRNFANAMRGKDLEYHKTDFTLVNLDGLDSESLVYLDPPYLLTDTGYTKSWSSYHEQRLLNYIDDLHSKGIRFALSNVIESKGLTHTQLVDWSKKYNVHYLDVSYKNASHQRKDKTSPDVEVLITNYDPQTFEIIQLKQAA